MTSAWLAYFDRLGSSDVHRAQAAHYVRSLMREIGLEPDQRVLDLGCGPGSVAHLVAPHVAEIWWWDPSPNMRALADKATAPHANARYCDLDGGEIPSPGAPFDLILMNSVAQYMPPMELWTWLGRWRGMLAPGGRVVVSDLIGPDHRSVFDVIDLLRFGARRGSPIRALGEALGDVRDYRRTSRIVPLTRLDVDELRRHANEIGLDVQPLPRNLTHFRTRWTAVIRRHIG